MKSIPAINLASIRQRFIVLWKVTSALLIAAWCISTARPAQNLSGSPPVQQPAGNQAIYKARVNLVNVLFTVTDKNRRFVSDLTGDDFQIFEDNIPQQIQYFSNFSKTGDVPLTIALLVDTSGSVKDKLQLEIDTASEFLRKILRPNKDLALLIQFSSEVELLQDLTDNVARLEKALDSLRAGGGTSFYDAIYLAVNDKLRHEAGRKVVVALSDGDDNQSKVRKEEAVQAAQKADVLIYGIGVKSADFRADFGVMKYFAKETGGRFVTANVDFKEIQNAFQEIGRDLQNQYGIAYSSTNARQDGSFRKIEIRCKRKGLTVKARTGYYAPREEEND